MFNPGTFVM